MHMHFLGCKAYQLGHCGSRPISRHASEGPILADSMPHHTTIPCFKQLLAKAASAKAQGGSTGSQHAMQLTCEQCFELAITLKWPLWPTP